MPKKEITITVKKKSEARNPKPEIRSPNSLLSRVRGVKKPLKRRLKKKTGLINFYDLGQIKSGADWIDLPFQFVPEDIGYISDSADQMILENFSTDNWNDLKDKIMEVPIGEWANNYRKLDFDTAFNYGIDYFADGDWVAVAKPNQRPRLNDILYVSPPENSQTDNWTETGLKLSTATNRVKIFSFNAFYSFDTDDTLNFKVTETSDFEAAPTTLSLPENFDIFLVPEITLNSLVSAIPTIVSGTGFQHYLLNAFYSPLPRKLLFDLGLQQFLFDFYYFAWHETEYRTVGIGTSAAASFVDYFKSLPDARAFYFNLGDAGTLSPPRDRVSVSAFPTTGLGENGFWFKSEAVSAIGSGESATSAQSRVNDESGVLIAVIKTASKTYFVWKNSSSGFAYSDFDNSRINFK